VFTASLLAVRSALSLQRCLATKGTKVGSSRYAPLSAALKFQCKDQRSMHHFHTVSHGGIHISHPQSLSSAGNFNSISSTITTRKMTKMVPRKAALALTPKARDIFKKIIAATGSEGIMLKYEISSQHSLRMAFKFDLVKDAEKEIGAQDEGVSLELLEDGVTPKLPSDSWNDNLPKLYIHHGAFMKVLGGTIDVELNSETGDLTPKLFNREGHEMEPND